MDNFEVNKDQLYVSPIVDVLAGEKFERKLLKLSKKIFQVKGVRRGVKEVCKAIRKKQKGIVLLAADISPVDVISHIPVLCEKAGIPYIYVRSRVELGLAAETKRPTSAVFLIQPKEGSSAYKNFEKASSLMKNKK